MNVIGNKSNVITSNLKKQMQAHCNCWQVHLHVPELKLGPSGYDCCVNTTIATPENNVIYHEKMLEYLSK